MNFKTAGFLVGASTLLRLTGGVLTVKMIAVSTGPDGLGQLGQLMSLLAICVMLAAGGAQNGVIAALAKLSLDSVARQRFWGTACSLGLVVTSILAIAIMASAPFLSMRLFKSSDFENVIRLFAVLQVALCYSTLASARIIADKQTGTFAAVSSAAVVMGLSGLSLLSWKFGVLGAGYGLLWSAFCPAIAFGVHQLWRHGHPKLVKFHLDRSDALYLGKFSLMAVISAVAMPMVQIMLRDHLLAHGGWAAVGDWQAVLRFSDVSIQFFGVLLGSYFLPRISTVTDRSGLQQHVGEAYRFLIPVVLLILAASYFFASFFVSLLFSSSFKNVVALLPWQSLGDALRCLSLVLGYVAVSRGNLKLHISAEFFQGGVMLLAGWLLIERHGTIGASYAYILTYALYLPICILTYWLYLRRLPKPSQL